MRKRNVLLVSSAGFIAALFIFVSFFIVTTEGSLFLVRWGISKYADPDNIEIAGAEGQLANTLLLRDISIDDSRRLPKPNALKIQSLKFDYTYFPFGALSALIKNGRITLPSSEPILFYGRYYNSEWDMNVYCRKVSVNEIVTIFSESVLLEDIAIQLTDVDFKTTGRLFSPIFQGSFVLTDIISDRLAIADCPGTFSLALTRTLFGGIDLTGEIVFSSGNITIHRSVVVLEESKILFVGDYRNPELAIKGTAQVEGLAITMTLKGTPEKPELRLTSDFSYPESLLLIMLATGKQWQGVGSSFKQSRVTADLAVDFIDYVLLGGKLSVLTTKLGISDLVIMDEDDKRGIGIKKTVTSKTDVGYAVEQKKGDEGRVQQTVSGGVNLTGQLSIEGAKELKSTSNTAEKTENSVMLKYKKTF
ncbi:MAG: translocation/assembly module TamB [Candidatus Omnitrophica bacterium]|nr:translocation/assembly module TamB [Candidatus Omnitrophota bacterium]